MLEQTFAVDNGAPVEELAPQEFKVEPVGRLVGDVLALVTKNLLRHGAH